MSTDTCPISHLAGDGCEKCNPALALEYAKGTIEDLERTLATKELEAKKLREALQQCFDAIRPLDHIHFHQMDANRHGKRLLTASYIQEALSTPITTDALDAYVAEEVKEARGALLDWWLSKDDDADARLFNVMGRILGLTSEEYLLAPPPLPAQPTEQPK